MKATRARVAGSGAAPAAATTPGLCGVLLDEDLPVGLTRYLSRHEAEHVSELGWKGLSNGDLLRAAIAARFEVLLTGDAHLPFQLRVAAAGFRHVGRPFLGRQFADRVQEQLTGFVEV